MPKALDACQHQMTSFSFNVFDVTAKDKMRHSGTKIYKFKAVSLDDKSGFYQCSSWVTMHPRQV